jgi:hypothetical protein
MPQSPPEIVIVVDRDNRVAGAVSRIRMRAERLPHRAAAIFVRNSQISYFVQRRAATKDIYPCYYAVTTGGVVQRAKNIVARRSESWPRNWPDAARRKPFFCTDWILPGKAAKAAFFNGILPMCIART